MARSARRDGYSRRLGVLAMVLVIAAALSVSACGRKNAPVHPEGAEYPKTYPQE